MNRRVELSKVKLNALVGYIFFFLYALANFIMSPVLLQYLGVTHFGVWKTAGRFFEFANIADGRSAQALKWVIANKQGSSTDIERRQFVGAALIVWLRFIPLVLVVLGLMVCFFPDFIKGIDISEVDLILGLGLILSANILIMPMMEIPEAVLIGTNHGYLAKGIQILYLLIFNFVMYQLLIGGYGLLVISVTLLFSTFLTALTTGFVAKAKIQWFSLTWPTKDVVSEFWRFSGWVWVWAIVEKILLLSELMLFASLIGVSFVAYYSFSSFVLLFGLSITLMAGAAITPYLGRLRAESDEAGFERLMNVYRELVLYLVLLIACGVLLLNQSFVSLWVGNEFYLGAVMNLLITVSFVQVALIRSEAQIHDVGLKIKNRVLFGVLGVVLGIAASAGLFMYIEPTPEWILTGLICGRFIMTVMFPRLVTKSMGGSVPLSRYLFGAAILYFCSSYGSIDSNTWLDFIFVTGAVFLILSIVLLPVAFSKKSLILLRKNIFGLG